MRKKIVAGNWKMNLDSVQAGYLLNELLIRSNDFEKIEMILFPPALYIQNMIADSSPIQIGTQNFYPAEKGAFTGEISFSQFHSLGVKYFLVGHSERRELFHEDHSFIKAKVDAVISINAQIVFCCGEPLSVRESGLQNEYVKKQLEESLFHLSESEIIKCVIAYEPVWSIGTGITASSQQAEEMHSSIRSWIKEKYSDDIADGISILYGGSCNASNAKELFACPNVDGGLIGGASLNADSFIQIALSF